MVVILGILAILVAIVLWVAKIAVESVYSFGGITLIIGRSRCWLVTVGRRLMNAKKEILF